VKPEIEIRKLPPKLKIERKSELLKFQNKIKKVQFLPLWFSQFLTKNHTTILKYFYAAVKYKTR